MTRPSRRAARPLHVALLLLLLAAPLASAYPPYVMRHVRGLGEVREQVPEELIQLDVFEPLVEEVPIVPILAATGGYGRVTLSWVVSTYRPLAFEVYRGFDPGEMTYVATTPTTFLASGTWTDHDVVNGRRYWYQIVPVSDRSTGPSNVATAIPANVMERRIPAPYPIMLDWYQGDRFVHLTATGWDCDWIVNRVELLPPMAHVWGEVKCNPPPETVDEWICVNPFIQGDIAGSDRATLTGHFRCDAKQENCMGTTIPPVPCYANAHPDWGAEYPARDVVCRLYANGVISSVRSISIQCMPDP